jgi:hypothetical protein
VNSKDPWFIASEVLRDSLLMLNLDTDSAELTQKAFYAFKDLESHSKENCRRKGSFTSNVSIFTFAKSLESGSYENKSIIQKVRLQSHNSSIGSQFVSNANKRFQAKKTSTLPV